MMDWDLITLIAYETLPEIGQVIRAFAVHKMLIGVLGVLLTLQASISKTITGTLMCSGKPYAGAEVQLQGEDVSESVYL
ncbi:hypothetical protein Q1695_006905 [Nippostrongylus brasiliensis]|nr:hypothetical protein Q1695_006905 [Nippostrongylus brasiliensis]